MGEYLRLYSHLSGVAGTVATEAERIQHGYGLTVEVMTAPERPGRRDHPDLLYGTTERKLQALVEAAAGYHAVGRPVLIRSDTPSDLARLDELLAAQGLTATAPHPRRPLAHAGRPGVVTLLGEYVPDREIVLGGDLDWLAEEEVLASGPDPVITSTAAWEEAVAGARRRLLPTWAADRQRVIEAGGLAVLGAELLESGWLEARTRELAGARGDTRFFLSLDEIRISRQGRFNRLAVTNPEPLTGWLTTKGVGRIRRRFHQRVIDLHCRAFDYSAVGSALRERFYAERRRLVEGPRPLAAAITMAGPNRAEELEADTANLADSTMADQVRSGARRILDEEWARCLRDLQSWYDAYWDQALPEDSLAGYQWKATERFETMRRDVRERLVDHLFDLRTEWQNHETVRQGWYYTRASGPGTWPLPANVSVERRHH